MSQAEALLNSLTENVVDHKHVVPDSDTYFMIDPYTRQIENTNYQKTVLMRGDHNSERFTFEIPRYVDGHDMSLCNRVIVHFDNVGDSIANIHSDVSYMTDLRINPDKPDTVISSWLIRREATQIVGILSFSLQYQCVEDGEITYEWNTDSYDDIEIRKSKNNGEAAVINYTNVLEQWRSQIFGAGDSIMSNITTEGANQVTAVKTESATQQAAIELKGYETLSTIPDDYTEVYNMASEAVRTKGDSIVCEEEGSDIILDDSSDDYIRGLNVYGKSTQVTTTGKNLFDVSKIANNSRVTNDNGVITVSTPEASSAVDSMTNLGVIAPELEVGKSYTLTFETTGTDRYIYLEEAKLMWSNGGTNTVTQEMLDSDVLFYASGVSTTATLSNFMLRDSAIVDATYEPYTGGMPSPNLDYPQEIVSVENPIVEVCSENLARSHRDGSINSVGLTVTQINNSSEVVINGTASSATSITVLRDIYLPVGQYTLSVYGLNVTSPSYDRVYVMDGSSNSPVNYVQPDRPQTFRINKPSVVSISIVFAEGSSYDNRTVKFQLEHGSVATEYKAYVGNRMTINQTLCGIPVASGGNYIDDNGQQWICDEVDLERGVLLKRIGEQIFDKNQSYHLNTYRLENGGYYVFGCTSDHESISDMPIIADKLRHKRWSEWEPDDEFDLICYTGYSFYFYLRDQSIQTSLAFKDYVTNNPIIARYVLATPVEIPLTAEEIKAFKSIKTNYPTTTITNNYGTWMSVKYNADPKLYMSRLKTGASATAKIGSVTLLASAWEGADSLYSQVVDIEGVTENSQVDLTPGIDQLAIFYDKDLSFVTENDRGVVTVYAIGQKPTNDYTIQVTITEVEV